MNKKETVEGKKGKGDKVLLLNGEKIPMSCILYMINELSKNETRIRGNNDLWKKAVEDSLNIDTVIDKSFCAKYNIQECDW